MARPGVIETHDDRVEIEAVIRAGGSYERVSKRWPEVSYQTYYRYRQKNLEFVPPSSVDNQLPMRPILSGDDLIAELERIKRETHEIFEIAKKAKDYRMALLALDKQTRQIEVFADMMIRVEELRRAAGNAEPIRILVEMVG